MTAMVERGTTADSPLRRRLIALLLVPALFPARAEAQGIPPPEVVVGDLEFPAGIAFRSDGTMFVTERGGRIRVVEEGRLQRRPLAEIPTVVTGETGLLGIAVTPDEDAVFVFATEPNGDSNSVWRVPLEDPGGAERVIEGLPGGGYHNGGGVAFDRDGMLLVSNGEEHSPDIAQDPDALGGKVYRYTPEGGVPDDNPFGDSPALAIGLRNPFGLTVDPSTGTPWVTENGPSGADEVNRIEPEGNYEWPEPTGPGMLREPALFYEQAIVPTGIAFAGDDARPRFRGDLFFATFGEGSIHRVQLNPARDEVVSDDVIVSGEQVIALAWGPEGLYYSTPQAVKLLPLAQSPDAAPSPSPTAGGGAASPAPQPDEEGEGGGVPWGLLAGAALVVGFLWLRQRLKHRSVTSE